MGFNLVSLVFAALIVTIRVAVGQQHLCPNNFGDYNDGGSCVTFIRCQNGVAYRLGCPRAQPFFDRQARRCTNQQQINCVQNNQAAVPVLAGRVGPAAIGQFQQPSINQVQIAGAPGFGRRGALPNAGGLLGQQPNAGAVPFAPGAANPRAAWPGRGGWGRGIPRAGGVPVVEGGASPTVAAAGANGGAAGGQGATAGVPAGVGNQAGDGNQPAQAPLRLSQPAARNPALPQNPAFAPVGNPGFALGGNPAFGPVGNSAFAPVGNPAFARGNPGFALGGNPGFALGGNPAFARPGSPIGFPARRVGFVPGQQLGNQGNFGNVRGGFLNFPGRQGQGQGQGQAQGQVPNRAETGGRASAIAAVSTRNGAGGPNQGRAQGQGQGQAREELGGLAGLVPFVLTNQRQSATINQDQGVGVHPAGKR